ncbi:MAG TPA: biopolymer transporter ExbD [Polyangia bacterium]|jgi:biopolymer transport protein ExbD
MSFAVGGKGPSSDINVTPLIDIVLVLLIIFMVLTPVMLKEIAAVVPRKATDDLPAPAGGAAIVLRMDADGHVSVAGESVALPALPAVVAERLAHDRQKVVFFDFDDRANYGNAVKVMDICKGAGARTLGIVTRD